MSHESSSDRFAELVDLLRVAARMGRLAHAYLIVGPPQGQGRALAETLLQLLYCSDDAPPCGRCSGCERVRRHEHPDVLWVEPESKSRRILIERIREEVLPHLSHSAYEGGWKSVVLVQADRLTEGAANAFLKMLEEPPPRTLLVLLSDAPQHILPTLTSRCQRLLLAPTTEGAQPRWRGRLMEILRQDIADSPLEAMAQASRLKALLEEAADEAVSEDEGTASAEELEARAKTRALEVRAAILRELLTWRRDVLLTVLGIAPRGADEALKQQAARLNYERALRRVRAVEALIRRLELNLPPEAVLTHFWMEC